MQLLRYHRVFGNDGADTVAPFFAQMNCFFALDLSVVRLMQVPVGEVGTRTLRTIKLVEDAGFMTVHWLMTGSSLTRLISVVMEVDEVLRPYIEELFTCYDFSSGLLMPPDEIRGRAAGCQDLVRPGQEGSFVGSICPPPDIQPVGGTCRGSDLRSQTNS